MFYLRIWRIDKNQEIMRLQEWIFRKEHFRAILSLSFIVIDWSHLLRKVNAGYKLGKQKKINHILFMHNFKVYGNSKKETERVTNTVRIFSKDIAMGFGISECADITIMQKNLLVLVECNSHQKNQYRTRVRQSF